MVDIYIYYHDLAWAVSIIFTLYLSVELKYNYTNLIGYIFLPFDSLKNNSLIS